MNMAAAHMLLRHPARLLPIFDQAIHALQKQWTDELPHGDPRRKTWHIKKNCHARLTHLPANVPELWKTKLPRSSDVGNFIEVRGVYVCGPSKSSSDQLLIDCILPPLGMVMAVCVHMQARSSARA